jgi:hypothetical protein
LGDVRKFDIKRKNFIAYTKDGNSVEFPLEESRPFVRAGCQVCLDFSQLNSKVVLYQRPEASVAPVLPAKETNVEGDAVDPVLL